MADALVRKLNELGYQPVFLPRTGVEPPELYSYSRADRRLVRLGELKAILPPGTVPAPTEGALSDIELHQTSSKKLSAAVDFLSAALKCIGISAAPKIELGFTGSTEFSFMLTGVRQRSVDPLLLTGLLQQLDLRGLPQDDLAEGRLHIVYEYAYANELRMTRGDKQDFDASVQGKVGEFIDLGGKGSVAFAGNSALTFKGQGGVAAAFAYKAGQLTRNANRWEFHPEQVKKGGFDETPEPFLPQPGIVLTVLGD